MAKKTTVKPISLGYRPVGSLESVEYTPLMGLLNDFAIAQDAADETNIEAEFYDSPWTIIYAGKPVKMTYTLVNYSLADLQPIFGGTYTPASATVPETYVAPASVAPQEFEWKVTYQQGVSGVIIHRGKTVATLKQENKGALGYAVTITSLAADAGAESTADDKMYTILGDPKTGA